MKLKFNSILFAAGILLASCGGGEKEQTAETREAGEAAQPTEESVTYMVNSDMSEVRFIGRKLGKYEHVAMVNIKEGQLSAKNSAVEAGNFVIDMTTIEEEGEGGVFGDPEKETKYETHLKSPDFFDVENYPTAKFEVVGVEGNQITGNLTLRDTTNQVTFPAEITFSGDTLRAKADLTIDRTKWNVRYGSGKFFEDLGDKVISDDVDIKANIVAVKK